MSEKKGIHLEMLRMAIHQAVTQTEMNIKSEMNSQITYYRKLCFALLILLSIVLISIIVLGVQLLLIEDILVQ